METLNLGQFYALLGAALSILLTGVGSAKGIGIAGEAAAGAISENPGIYNRALLLELLPGAQGIYGFLIGFMVLLKTNVLGGMSPLTVGQGLSILAGCLPVGIVGLFSAIFQGRVSAASMGLLARRPDSGGRGISLSIVAEIYAVLSLLASFLMVWFIKI